MSTFQNYEHWSSLFGQSTMDESVVSAFERAGEDAPPVIARDELEASVLFGEISVSVWAPVLFGRDGEFGDGVGILASATLHVRRGEKDGYTDRLPFDIERNETRERLRERFGEPETATRRSDVWMVEDRKVTVGFVGDTSRIKSVTVALPFTQ